MRAGASSRIAAQRASLAAAQAQARAEAAARARRERDAILLATRQQALATHAAAARAVQAPATVPAYVSQAVYSYASLGRLWLAAGGSPAAETTAACIGEAESGGYADATHTDASGQVDYGVFQIGNDPAAANPLTGALMAVRMSSQHDADGEVIPGTSGTDWEPWSTRFECGV